MKLPKSVIITGKRYRVVLDPQRDDGEFDMEKMAITIGTQNPADVLENFLHEVWEGILLSRGNRYSVYVEGNDKLRFVQDHAELENAIKDLALAIEGIIRK